MGECVLLTKCDLPNEEITISNNISNLVNNINGNLNNLENPNTNLTTVLEEMNKNALKITYKINNFINSKLISGYSSSEFSDLLYGVNNNAENLSTIIAKTLNELSSNNITDLATAYSFLKKATKKLFEYLMGQGYSVNVPV